MKALYCILLLYFFSSCGSDPDALTLKLVNEAVIEGLDSSYVIEPSATLKLRPQITFTKDLSGDSTRYRYEWTFALRVGFSDMGDYKVIGTAPTLDYQVSHIMGGYSFVFRVHDTHTKLFSEWPFKVFVANEFYEGWVLLCEDEGRSRLDMLSYEPISDRFTHLPNILHSDAQTEVLSGAPKYVDFFLAFSTGLSAGGTMVVTANGAYALENNDLKIQSDVFKDNPELSGFSAAEISDASFVGGMYNSYLYVTGNIYNRHESSSYVESDFSLVSQVIRDNQTLAGFRASPYMGIDDTGYSSNSVFFDDDNGEFVWHANGGDYCFPLVSGNVFDVKRAWHLESLKYVRIEGGQYVATMRDIQSGQLYINRFTLHESLSFAPVHLGADFYHAEHVVVDPNTGLMYYSVGSRVYRYDESTGQGVLLADFGNTITLLKFNSFLFLTPTGTGTTINHDRYEQYQNSMLITTSDAQRGGDSDTFFVYDMVQKRVAYTYSGLPKIVDITYKER